MNREIKFRAWEIKKKEWHYFTVPFDIGRTVAGMSFPLYYENWCQYTGLKDKNGKEIYEGDLVYFRSNNLVVSWITAVCAFELTKVGRSIVLNKEREHEIEVIGNIWENPDLINEV